MILGIDASNIRDGGGVTHLVELLKASNPSEHGFTKVIVWAGKKTLDKIEDKDWLEKKYESLLDKSLPYRTYWQRYKLDELIKTEKCSILFVPGGTYYGRFRPFVTMSQNLLPFEWREIKRYGFSKDSIRFILLRFIQSKTFKRANGIIFLTNYARKVVIDLYNIPLEKTEIIHHGINKKFFKKPKEQKKFSSFTDDNPAKILYVSFIGAYKHQWNVVRAIGQLSKNGMKVELNIVGSPNEKIAYRKFNDAMNEVDPHRKFIKYFPKIEYFEIEKVYENADIFLFASSCETFGQILTEAMATGLPIASSNLSAMPELLGASGVYFHPENPTEISNALETLIKNKDLRNEIALSANEKAKLFSWEKCAKETLNYLKSNLLKD